METKSPRRLIVVSNRLPFKLIKKDDGLEIRQSDGGLVSALKGYFESNLSNAEISSTLWIGTAEFSEKTWVKFNKKNNVQNRITVEPIFLEKKIYNKYYNGFCNATIWPLFHYFPSFVEFDNGTFKSYEEVNHIFASKVLAIIRPGDILWVHDYQLMLLPQLIRNERPTATIGFFLHIPFPSFEIFRLLHRPWKEKIIDGLLGADVIGFHTHEYVQHFLKTVQMIRGFDHEFRTIYMNNHLVKVEMFPLGIDFEKFHNARNIIEVKELTNTVQDNFAGKKIIFSVDRLDYTKGITHRLSGFEKFLEQHHEWFEKVVFVLDVVPSRQILSKYNERKKLIEEQIGRINGKYSTLSWQPIIYRYNNLSFNELCAMYNAADIALITPLRDGMNLVAKEYVASRLNSGVLILSEFAGAANELGESILVNPVDDEEVCQAILRGLQLSNEEQHDKIKSLQTRLKNYTVFDWVNEFLKQLDETKDLQYIQQTKFLNESSILLITNKFKFSKKRLLLLDYDGTLVPFTKFPDQALPNKTLTDLLRFITSDVRNDVTIISGRDQNSLEQWFGNLPVNLVAEHGAGIRLKNQEWQYHADVDFLWKRMVRPMLEIFIQRSPGAFIEEKSHTLVWHYRNVDPELGFIRSRELLDSLHSLTRNSQLSIIDGNKVIEIRTTGIDKGVVTKKLVYMADYDFVLAIGDDKTDEDMFKTLSDKAYTIKIGPGHTSAKYHIPTQSDVIKLLNVLVGDTVLINN